MYKATIFAPWFGPVYYTHWLQSSVDNGRSIKWVIPSDQPQCIYGDNVVWVPDTLPRIDAYVLDVWGVAAAITHGYRLCDLREGFRELWPGHVEGELWGWSDWDAESRLDRCELVPGACLSFHGARGASPLFIAPTGYESDRSWLSLLAAHHRGVDELYSMPVMAAQCGVRPLQADMASGPVMYHRVREKYARYGCGYSSS